jgi:hypothetical protein
MGAPFDISYVYRKEYESDTLRGNLGLQVPVNRYTEAASKVNSL